MKAIVKLHDRHMGVCQLMDIGLNKHEIAAVMGISPATAYWHIRREQARRARSFAAALEMDRGGTEGEFKQ